MNESLKDTSEDYSYLIEKTSLLISTLLIGKGTAKQRLIENEEQILVVLALEAPKELKKMYKKIFDALHKKPPIKIDNEIRMTSFRNTLIYMKNTTASKIIKDIDFFHRELKQYVNHP